MHIKQRFKTPFLLLFLCLGFACIKPIHATETTSQANPTKWLMVLIGVSGGVKIAGELVKNTDWDGKYNLQCALLGGLFGGLLVWWVYLIYENWDHWEDDEEDLLLDAKIMNTHSEIDKMLAEAQRNSLTEA